MLFGYNDKDEEHVREATEGSSVDTSDELNVDTCSVALFREMID